MQSYQEPQPQRKPAFNYQREYRRCMEAKWKADKRSATLAAYTVCTDTLASALSESMQAYAQKGRQMPTMIPLHSESGDYREWLVTITGVQYCVVQEGHTWTVMRNHGWRTEPDWKDEDYGVDYFLSAHGLTLGA